MKALILAAGRGKRLGELTKSKNKCLIEVRGKPLIGYSLDCAGKIDVSEIVIVVGYQAEEIKNLIGSEYNRKPVEYVIQSEQEGLVDAIECAKQKIGNEEFCLFLGDELMVNPRHFEMVEEFKTKKSFASVGVIKVEDPGLISKTYGIQEEDNGEKKLIEKPDADTIKNGLVMKDIMGTGNCVFSNDVFKYIKKTPINQKRGERELPDLINEIIKDGQKVDFPVICDKYFNVNVKEEIKDAESYFAHFSESEKKLS